MVRLKQKEGNSMELVKSKGMIIFLIVVLGITLISSINTKKYDERNAHLQQSYVSMNIK